MRCSCRSVLSRRLLSQASRPSAPRVTLVVIRIPDGEWSTVEPRASLQRRTTAALVPARTTTSASVSRCHARRPAFPQASRTISTLGVRYRRSQGRYSSQGWLLGCCLGVHGGRRILKSPSMVARAGDVNHVKSFPYNKRINATVRLVTPRACARVAPIRPARYAQR